MSRQMLVAAFALPLIALPSAASAAIFNVSTSSELAVAAKAAVAGDIVLLAPGDYAELRLFRRRTVDGRVQFSSADPNQRARIAYVNLEGAEGFLFTNLEFAGSRTPLVAITGTARNIAFHGNNFRGANPNQDPWDDNNTAVYIRNASLISFTANDFQDLRTAMYVQKSYDVIISQSSFTHLREGINVASLGRGDIVGNVFHSFSPKFANGEHPDAIQFWTRGETWGSHDISLRNNYFALGGQRMIHGIFARSEESESYGRPVFYSRFTVTGNVYYGSALHGITLSSVNGAEVYGNVVAASPWADTNNSNLKFPDGRSSGGLQPQLRLVNGSDIKAWNNVAMGGAPAAPGATSWDHIKIYDTHSKKGEPWTTAFKERPTADIPPLSAFVSAPGTAAAMRGIGLLKEFTAGPVPAQTSALQRKSPGTLLASQPAKP